MEKNPVKMEKNPVFLEEIPVKMEIFFAWILSCLRYASVPVSNNDSLVTNSFDFALISLAVIIFVNAGIAISTGVYSSLSFLFWIVVSIVLDTHISPVCVHTKNKLQQRKNSKNPLRKSNRKENH
jgi:hypothetical protein